MRSERNAPRLRDELTRLISFLVDYPDEVEVWENRDRRGTRFEVHVAPEDLGKVIGKQGRTARAMRTILSAASAKVKKRTVLEIIE